MTWILLYLSMFLRGAKVEFQVVNLIIHVCFFMNIHKETHMNNQINDKNTAKPNIIFETLIHKNTNRARTTE
jgi:hypothetical protein